MNDTVVSDHENLDVVLFTAGGWRVGLEARHVRGSRPAPSATDTADVASLLGLTPTGETSAARQCLALKPLPQQQRNSDREIQVEAPVDLVSLPASLIHPLPPLLAARTCLPGLCALALPAEQVSVDRLILLFDATRLRADE